MSRQALAVGPLFHDRLDLSTRPIGSPLGLRPQPRPVLCTRLSPKGLQRPPNAPQGLAEALERRRFRGCPPSRSRSITGGEPFPGRIVPLPPSFATTYPDRTLIDRVSAFLAGQAKPGQWPCAWPGPVPGPALIPENSQVTPGEPKKITPQGFALNLNWPSRRSLVRPSGPPHNSGSERTSCTASAIR